LVLLQPRALLQLLALLRQQVLRGSQALPQPLAPMHQQALRWS
jgi:hypothetical protein